MKTLPPQTIGMKWFPKREGMAMGIVVGGFGFGAFVFNQVSCMEKGHTDTELCQMIGPRLRGRTSDRTSGELMQPREYYFSDLRTV